MSERGASSSDRARDISAWRLAASMPVLPGVIFSVATSTPVLAGVIFHINGFSLISIFYFAIERSFGF